MFDFGPQPLNLGFIPVFSCIKRFNSLEGGQDKALKAV